MERIITEEIKDGKRHHENLTKEQLIEKYKELDSKVDKLLNKIKIRRNKDDLIATNVDSQ